MCLRPDADPVPADTELAFGEHQRFRLARDTPLPGTVIVLEAPDLAARGLHHQLTVIDLPCHRSKARDRGVTAWFDGHRHLAGTCCVVRQGEDADLAGAPYDVPVPHHL